ncbi:MAG TPA: methylated-DNA--[protein]-cysteine S-methyltransferase [Methylomirabilota bacterium]|nr:methylated-DNA--[protein]-cysteine S-methyltransferase [Methylomirabilota bacterium]
MKTDRIDLVLKRYFRPDAEPGDLAKQVLMAARASARETSRLLDRISIQATSEGVSLIRAERMEKPATAAARRVAQRAREELAEYFQGKRAFFSVPVDLSGAPDFQRKVLAAARRIPFGEVRPYAWVAQRIGHPRAVRAVGTALGRNPVPFLVPCHRVLQTGGGLGGYLFGMDVKSRLLSLERTTPVYEGCASTHIVCRVGCVHGRHMRADNRVVFASVDDARSVGYRPCKVCKPQAA